MVTEISKMAYFSADGSKKLATFWTKYLSAPERSCKALSENSMVNSCRLWVIEIINIKKTAELRKNPQSRIFKGILIVVAPNSVLHSIFLNS